MKHPDIQQPGREASRKVWVWLIAVFVCFSGGEILSAERDWRYMLLITSPYLALLTLMLGLAARGGIRKRRVNDHSSFAFPESVIAAVRERFFVRSSECVQPDRSAIRMATTNESAESNITLPAPDVSIDDGDSYYAKALAVCAWLWLLVALPFLTDAACPFVAAGALSLFWLILAFFWVCGLLAASSILRSRATRNWWLSAALAGLLGLLLAFTDNGFVLRVMLSERALDAYVAAVPRGANDSLHSNRQVGLFLVDGTEERNGVVVLYTCSSFLDRHGILYVPDGAIPPSDLSVKHLLGKWYSFRWHF